MPIRKIGALYDDYLDSGASDPRNALIRRGLFGIRSRYGLYTASGMPLCEGASGGSDPDADELPAQQRVLHQVTAAVEMLFHARARAGGVTPRDRFGDLLVRGRRGLGELTEVHAERHEPVDLREAPFDQLEREGVARARGDRQMELDVRRFRLPVVRSAHRHAGERAEPFDVGVGRELGRARRRRAFEQPPDVERVVNLLDGDARHEVPMADDAIEVAFLPEPRESFADRRAAHAVLAREADFRQRGAGAVASLDEAGLEISVRAFDVGRMLRAPRGSGLGHPGGVYRADPAPRNSPSVVSSVSLIPAGFTRAIHQHSGAGTIYAHASLCDVCLPALRPGCRSPPGGAAPRQFASG